MVRSQAIYATEEWEQNYDKPVGDMIAGYQTAVLPPLARAVGPADPVGAGIARMTAEVTSQPELDSAVLAGLGNIPADYRHHEKLISPGPDLALPGSYLKWYDVRRPEVEIPAELAAEGRQFLAEQVAAGRLAIDGELGFVICHRCGESFYFLLVCTWRNQNEMWESVYAQDLAVGGGSPWCRRTITSR